MTTSLFFTIQLVVQLSSAEPIVTVTEMPISVNRVIEKVETQSALGFLARITAIADRITAGKVSKDLAEVEAKRKVSGLPTGVYRLRIFPRDNPEVVSVRHADSLVSVVLSVKTGRVIRFGFGSVHGDAKYTIERCRERAETFYRAAAGKYRLGEPFVTTYGSGGKYSSTTADFLFDQIIPTSKFPIGGRVQAIMNMTTGLPETIEMSYPPEYEPAGRIASPLELDAVAARVGKDATGWASVRLGSTGPRYEVPNYLWVSTGLTAADRKLASAGKAKLIQEYSVNDASSYDAKENRYRRFVQVILDAQTVKPLALIPVYLMQGAAGGVNLPVRPEGKTWTLGRASGLLTPVGKATPPAEGKTLALRAGLKEWIFPVFHERRWYLDGQVYSANEKLDAEAARTEPLPKIRLNSPAPK